MDIRAARTWRNRRTATLRALGDVGHIQALTTAHSGLRVVLGDGLGEVRPCRTSHVVSTAAAPSTSSTAGGESPFGAHRTTRNT